MQFLRLKKLYLFLALLILASPKTAHPFHLCQKIYGSQLFSPNPFVKNYLELTVDIETYTASFSEIALNLTAKEINLLFKFLENPARVLSAEEIYLTYNTGNRNMKPIEEIYLEETVRQIAGRLKRKISKQIDSEFPYIHSKPLTRGYRFLDRPTPSDIGNFPFFQFGDLIILKDFTAVFWKGKLVKLSIYEAEMVYIVAKNKIDPVPYERFDDVFRDPANGNSKTVRNLRIRHAFLAVDPNFSHMRIEDGGKGSFQSGYVWWGENYH